MRVKGVVLTFELPLWRFHDLIDLLSGKLNHIAPDIKPSEGSARVDSADNPLPGFRLLGYGEFLEPPQELPQMQL